MSSIGSATSSGSSAPLGDQIQIALAVKAQNVAKFQGAAVLSMLEQSVKLADSLQTTGTPGTSAAPDSPVGGQVDVRA